jgi:hypothetical protein
LEVHSSNNGLTTISSRQLFRTIHVVGDSRGQHQRGQASLMVPRHQLLTCSVDSRRIGQMKCFSLSSPVLAGPRGFLAPVLLAPCEYTRGRAVCGSIPQYHGNRHETLRPRCIHRGLNRERRVCARTHHEQPSRPGGTAEHAF